MRSKVNMAQMQARRIVKKGSHQEFVNLLATSLRMPSDDQPKVDAFRKKLRGLLQGEIRKQEGFYSPASRVRQVYKNRWKKVSIIAFASVLSITAISTYWVWNGSKPAYAQELLKNAAVSIGPQPGQVTHEVLSYTSWPIIKKYHGSGKSWGENIQSYSSATVDLWSKWGQKGQLERAVVSTIQDGRLFGKSIRNGNMIETYYSNNNTIYKTKLAPSQLQILPDIYGLTTANNLFNDQSPFLQSGGNLGFVNSLLSMALHSKEHSKLIGETVIDGVQCDTIQYNLGFEDLGDGGREQLAYLIYIAPRTDQLMGIDFAGVGGYWSHKIFSSVRVLSNFTLSSFYAPPQLFRFNRGYETAPHVKTVNVSSAPNQTNHSLTVRQALAIAGPSTPILDGMPLGLKLTQIESGQNQFSHSVSFTYRGDGLNPLLLITVYKGNPTLFYGGTPSIQRVKMKITGQVKEVKLLNSGSVQDFEAYTNAMYTVSGNTVSIVGFGINQSDLMKIMRQLRSAGTNTVLQSKLQGELLKFRRGKFGIYG